MTRTARLARIALGVTLFATVAACVFNINFDNTQTIVVDASGASLDKIQAVNLSTQPDVQAHKGNINSLALNQAVLTITAVDAANTWTSVTGSVALRPDGVTDASQDVQVGSLTNFAITANNTVTLTGTTQLDAFVLTAIKGTGKFQIVMSGAAAGGTVGKFTVTAVLKLGMEYQT